MLAKTIRVIGRAFGDKKGISALDYGILAAVVVGLVATAATTLGGDVGTAFGTIGTSLKTGSTAGTAAATTAK